MEYRNSNHYETEYSNLDIEPGFPQDERELVQAPLDDRDEHSPDFTVDDELAYNLDVEAPPEL